MIAVGDFVDHGPDSDALLHLARYAAGFLNVCGRYEAMVLESIWDRAAKRIWKHNQNEQVQLLSDTQLKGLAKIIEGIHLAIALPPPNGQ